MYGFGVFFFGNNLQGMLLQSGAFEIFINDKLVYSKLATGQMPTFPIIQELFMQHGIILQ